MACRISAHLTMPLNVIEVVMVAPGLELWPHTIALVGARCSTMWCPRVFDTNGSDGGGGMKVLVMMVLPRRWTQVWQQSSRLRIVETASKDQKHQQEEEVQHERQTIWKK